MAVVIDFAGTTASVEAGVWRSPDSQLAARLNTATANWLQALPLLKHHETGSQEAWDLTIAQHVAGEFPVVRQDAPPVRTTAPDGVN